jgi:hypothetical protein
VVSLDISDLGAPIGKLRGSYTGRLLKLPCVINVELVVMSGLGVLHLWRSCPGIMDLSQKSYSKASAAVEAYSNKEGLGPQETLCGETEDSR